MTRFLEFIQPDLARLSLGGILADIRTSMMDEVDFTKVCATLEQTTGLAFCALCSWAVCVGRGGGYPG